MPLTVATWNINSVRLRIDNVRRMLAESDIDVLCLQETKTVDELFPAQAFAEAGYPHQIVHGMKGYNGVAIVSRLPFEATGDAENERSGGSRQWCGKEDCRHAWVRLHHGVEVHSIYIPAGGDIPDPAENVKFAHKLQFLDELTAWLADGAMARGRTILTGDFNVAPLENDVWSHKQLLKIVSHTPVEVEKLTALREAGGLVDAVRHFVPETEKLYSWWSYRSANWALADKGRRLDHIWVTPDLVPHLGGYSIAKETRGWEQPSDHVPVSVRFDGI